MDDAGSVGIRERVQRLLGDREQPIGLQAPLSVEDLLELFAFDVVHDEIHLALVRRAEVVDFDDVRVLERGHRPSLALETRDHL